VAVRVKRDMKRLFEAVFMEQCDGAIIFKELGLTVRQTLDADGQELCRELGYDLLKW